MKIPTMVLGIGLLLVSACGSSDGESASTDAGGTAESSTFASADGVVSVVVPEGAAPSSFVGSAELSDGASLGADLEPDAGVVLVYDLGPGGTTFSEPVTVTVRVSPGLGDFDPESGVPIAVLLIEDGNGGFEQLKDSRVVLDGETLVLEGETTHFSKLVVYVGTASVRLEVGEQYETGEQFRATLVFNGMTESQIGFPIWDLSGSGVINYLTDADGGTTADLLCERVGTDTVAVDLDIIDPAELFLESFFLGSAVGLGATLEATVTCVDSVTTAPPPPGLDLRAHIVSIKSYVTDDGTHGFIVGFAKEWDGLPVLYSFFVELMFTLDGRSMMAGVETHAGVERTWGPGAKFIMMGMLVLETDFPYNPDDVFQVTGRSGSQDTSDSEATFDTYLKSDVSTANATTIDPGQIEVVIDEGTPENLKAAQPTAASNDGEKITITFAGNLKALVDGGAYKVRINAQATDGGIRVTVTLRSTDGELLLNGTTFNDADKVGSSTVGKDVETTWVWSPDGNEVVIDMVSPDGVAIPSTSVTVAVTVQEQESSAPIDLNLQ